MGTNEMKRYRVFSRDMMKYLAIFIMFWGHLIGWVILDRYDGDVTKYYELPLWEIVLIFMSIFCPPVMFFFIADGYRYTRDRKKYAVRLLVFAVITQPFDWLCLKKIQGWWHTNVLFSLFLGLLAIIAWESRFRLWQRIALVILICGASVLIQSDWMLFGIVMILFLHIFREKPRARHISYMGIAALNCVLNLLSLGKVPTVPLLVQAGTMLLMFIAAYLCMTVFYSGRKGKHPTFAKWFFYCFYPLHYIVIWAVQRMVNH